MSVHVSMRCEFLIFPLINCFKLYQDPLGIVNQSKI
uniref:Uncharacterized protein n=1 Tax=Rhizophora mucronata TaxID=61149 RepID=A0A2P2NRK4_RHIMU